MVLKPGESADADALTAHCAQHLSKHKLPRYVRFFTAPLPRNASGKFLRRELRESLETELTEA